MKFCLRITVEIPSNRIMPVSILTIRNVGVLLVLVDIVGKLCKTDILISSTLPRPGLPEPVWGQPSTHKHWRKRKSSHKIQLFTNINIFAFELIRWIVFITIRQSLKKVIIWSGKGGGLPFLAPFQILKKIVFDIRIFITWLTILSLFIESH